MADKNAERNNFHDSLGHIPHLQFIGILACSCNSKKNVRVEASMKSVESMLTCSICGNVYVMTASKFVEEVDNSEEKDD